MAGPLRWLKGASKQNKIVHLIIIVYSTSIDLESVKAWLIVDVVSLDEAPIVGRVVDRVVDHVACHQNFVGTVYVCRGNSRNQE